MTANSCRDGLPVLRAMLFALLPVFAGAEPLPFDEAVRRVETRNAAVHAAESVVEQRDAERDAARGLRYPELDVEIRRYMLDNPVTVGIDGVPLSLEVQSDHFWSGQLTMTWPLYTGGRVAAANEAAAARRDEATAGLRTTRHVLLTELAERYFGVLLAHRAREVQALKLEAMAAHEARARRLFEEGVIAQIEHLNVQVAVAEAERELADAERAVTIVQEALANTVSGEGPFLPVTPLFVVRDLEPRETFRGYVASGHPVMQTLEAKEHLARQGVRAEKGAYRPTVYAFGSRELVPDDLTMLDPEWALGLGLQFTLFDAGRRHKVRAAEAQTEQVEHLRRKYRRDLETLVVKRYEEMAKALDQYDSLGATLRLTAENLRVRTRAFEEGLATSVEVIDATLSDARARLGRYKAAYDFGLALFQLLEASGRSSQWADYLARAEPVAENPCVAQAAAPTPPEKEPHTHD